MAGDGASSFNDNVLKFFHDGWLEGNMLRLFTLGNFSPELSIILKSYVMAVANYFIMSAQVPNLLVSFGAGLD